MRRLSSTKQTKDSGSPHASVGLLQLRYAVHTWREYVNMYINYGTKRALRDSMLQSNEQCERFLNLGTLDHVTES